MLEKSIHLCTASAHDVDHNVNIVPTILTSQALDNSHARELRQQIWYEVSPATVYLPRRVLDFRNN